MVWAVERFPPPQFETDYVRPEVLLAKPRPVVWDYIDLAFLAIGLGTASWLAHRYRHRRAILGLMLASVLYLGFFRKGCICPVGAVQNVVLAIANSEYNLPLSVVFIFGLPLLFALFFGRVFCGAICPLGAVQDLVLLRPVAIPVWLESIGRLAAYIYLGLAIASTAISGVFLVCRYDPFVSAFRFSGNLYILILGGCILLIALFIGRPYCRFLCPYGVILRNLSRLTRRMISISPDKCIDCGLCAKACPFGAIRPPVTRPKGQAIATLKALLLWWVAASTIIMLAGFFLGSLAARGIARLDSTVQMASNLQAGSDGPSHIRDAVAAYLASGGTAEALLEKARVTLARYRMAGGLLGGWIGLVIGLKALGACIKWPQDGYRADPASCLACGRCFAYCPREHLRRGKLESHDH